MRQFRQDGLIYYKFDTFDDEAVDHAIFSRQGGSSQGPYTSLNLGGTNGDDPSAVLANHEKLFEVFGRPYSSRFDVWQVHGKTILFSDAPRPPERKHPPADGIFTDKPEVTLIMRFADCVPLVFHDPVQKVVGIVHGGWQGTLLRIGSEAVSEIQNRYGSSASDLHVGLGPSICGNCYQVGEDVRKQFLQAWGIEAEQFFAKTESGLYLDLWGANEWVLRQAGVEHIENSGFCTAEHLDEWYSYRKERGLTGRFAVVIALK
jgi:YfiH family protein